MRRRWLLPVLLLALAGALVYPCLAQPPGGWPDIKDYYERAQPIPDVDKNPDIIFEPPFLHVLWPGYGEEALRDPKATVHSSVFEWTDESRHTALITPAGVHITRVVSRVTLKEPPPEAYGQHDREWNAPVIPFLKALSAEQLKLLIEGRIVDVTSCRSEVASVLFRKGSPTNKHRDDGSGGTATAAKVADAPYLVASFIAAPVIALFLDAPYESPSVRLAGVSAAHPIANLADVQAPADGGVEFWCQRAAVAKSHGKVPPTSGPWTFRQLAADAGSVPTDEFLAILKARLPQRLQELSLDQLNGCRVDEVLRDLAKASGLAFTVDDRFEGARIFAGGAKMPVTDALEALFLAAWISPPPDPLGSNPGAAFFQPLMPLIKTERMRMAAEQAPDLETREGIAHYVGSAADAERFTTLPLPVSRFTSGWVGRLSDLQPEEAAWVREQLPHWAALFAPVEDVKRWTAPVLEGDPSRLVIRTSMVYQLEFGACVPHQEYDKQAAKYVPRPVPESYYTELGASRDRPVYSVLVARYAFE